MSKKNSKSFFFFSILIAAFSILFSCNVGLGDAVDTEVPKVSISYPPASRPVRDWFFLAGTCSDDKGVASVSILATNTETSKTYGPYSATVSDGTWTCKINEKSDGKFLLVDGKYSFDVTAKDTSGRVSGVSSRTFEIDNTAPVFIIRNPGTINANNPSSFGSILKVAGTVADDHDIYELSVSIYESADMKGEPKAVLTEKNVNTAGGMEVTLARFNPEAVTDPSKVDELHENYLKVYNVDGGGNQNFFASVSLKDCAEVWQNPKNSQADSIGNSTEGGLFLTDDVYDSLMGKKSEYGQLSAADFKKILNGTYLNSATQSDSLKSENKLAASVVIDESVQKEILKKLQEAIKNTSSTPLAFKMNKDANPTYSVMGYSFNVDDAESFEKFGDHKTAKQSLLTFNALAGLDGTLIKPSSLKIYMFGPYDRTKISDSELKETLKRIYKNPDNFYKEVFEKAKEKAGSDATDEIIAAYAKAQILKDFSTSEASSTESFTEPFELPAVITKGQYYVLAASGQDLDERSLITSNYYGFVGESAGSAPSVSITGFIDGVSNELKNIDISGTLISEESEVSSVAYEITVQDEINAKVVGTIEGEASLTFESNKRSAAWKIADILSGTSKYENGYTSCIPTDGNRFKYTLEVTGKDSNGLISKDKRSFVVDMKLPIIKINDITPVAKKETIDAKEVYVVNGKIKFSAVVTDTNLSKVTVSVSDENNTSKVLYNGENSTIEKEFDTTEFANKGILTFTVKATDTAGNIAESTKADVYVDQSSDKPVLKFTNGKTTADGISKWENATNGQNAFGIQNNNNATFTITDDDGLTSLEVTVLDENGKVIGSTGAVSIADAQLQVQENSENAKENAANPVKYKIDGSTSYSLSYKLPQKSGKYILKIQAVDVGSESASAANEQWHSSSCESYIFITEGSISISFVDISNNTCKDRVVAKEIGGTVSLSRLENLENIECYTMQENAEGIWEQTTTALAKFKLSESESALQKIDAQEQNGKIYWTTKIPASNIQDGEQHFYFKATDKFSSSTSVELTFIGDGTPPKIKPDNSVFYDKWKNTSMQKISVFVADIDGHEPSGIKEVTCSYTNKTKVQTERTLTPESGKYNEEGIPSSDGKGKWLKYSTSIDDLPDGESVVINFTATDNVGNSTPSQYSLKLDTTAPSITKGLIDKNDQSDLFIKKGESIKINYEIKETGSGITAINVSTDSNMKNAFTLPNINLAGTYSCSFDDLKLTDGEKSLYIQVKDNAGNLSEIKNLGSFTVDTILPKVLINSPATGNTVNKTIDLSGTVVENNLSTEKPTLKYKKVDEETWNTYDISDSQFNHSPDQSWIISNIDTTKLKTKLNSSTQASDFEFLVIFKDLAKNENVSLVKGSDPYTYKLTVDQNADRPDVKLTNILISGSKINSKEIVGVITDDDGDYSNLKLYRIEKTEYDSNSTKNATPSTAGNSWTQIENVDEGTGIWRASLADDEIQGEKNWYFYVIDSKGGTFCSVANSSLAKIYLSDSKTTKQDSVTGISFVYDSEAPKVEIKVTHDQTNWEDTNFVFGKEQSVYVKAVVTEEVGMDSVTLTVNGITQTIQSTDANKVTGKESEYEYKFEKIDLNSAEYEDIPDGSISISVEAKDSSGQKNKDMKNITIDKTAPTVKIVSPTTAVSDAITGAVTIKGIAQDNASSISRVQYLIPTVAQAKLEKTVENFKAANWKDIGNSGSWEIQFASGAAESPDSILYYVGAKENNTNVYAVEQYGSDEENLWKVPVYFQVTDSCGNSAVRATYKDSNSNEEKPLFVIVDPDGGKPKAWINSPEEGSTTSGLVTIYGGASDDISVDKVQIQIDANGDGNFDSADYTLLNSASGIWAGTEANQNLGGSASDWWISANGTNSWKRAIDTDKIAKSSDGKKYLRFRVRAYDGDTPIPQTRGWSKVVSVNIDSEVPVIKDLKVVQFGAGVTADSSTVTGLTPITEREYISGMYISNIMEKSNGTFYLVGTVTDNQQVKTITFEKQTTSSSVPNIDLGISKEVSNSTASYNLCVPLKTEQSGQIYYIIKAFDDNTGETTQSIVINIDSTKPGMFITGGSESLNIGENLRLKSLGKNLGTDSSNSTVVNSNSYFTFGDIVNEAGSGLAYIVATFERNGSVGGKRIYNPMQDNTKLALASNETEAFARSIPYICEEGFAIQKFDVTRDDEYSIKATEFTQSAILPFIQKGGLVRIAGTYCLITDFDKNNGTITLSKSVSKDFKKAELIFAQVIDHQIVETPKTDGGVENDDGDGMVETITQTGSSYNWTASIDSLNIPDGPITIHVVAIDNAGNTNYGYVKTKVENNRPRIAKVMLATDLNGNGKFDYDADSAPETGSKNETLNNRTADGAEFGEFSFYSAMEEKSTNLKDKVALKSDKFNVIGGLAILPEFVGGNGDIWYVEKYSNDSSSTDYTQISTGVVNAGLAKMVSKTDLIGSDTKFANKDTNPSNVTYADLISEKGGIILNSVPKKYISFTFWDSTEETTPGTDSQWAHLMIPVTVLSSETEKPVPTITPFYWESKSENSVEKDSYGNLLGHIELEGDLTSELMLAYEDTVSLKKPKVSGKIKIEGTVTDNVRISSIKMGFDDLFSPTVLANYVSGAWQTVSSLPTGVISFTAQDVSISQKGHEAKYTLVVDTEKLKGVAGKGKKIVITATDWKENKSTAGTVQTTATAKTAMYTVDVVPYVTQVWTDLSEFYRSAPSVYARSAKGKYPVNENETVTLKGYNLGTSLKVALNGSELTGSALSYNIGKTAKSGKLEVSVGDIKAVNNLNNDTVEYNLQPNGVNNNILNDNLEFDVWQFKAAATAKNGPILQPHMRIGPSGELGFSYANATLYFNMPGKASNSTTYGQTPFGRNFGGFTQNTFTYDSNGNAYGVALCPDTSGEAGMSANLQFFSRTSGLHEGEGGGDLNNNYYNQNYARRIENTSIKLDGSSISQHINRILSPSMATYTESGTTYVYVAYYDELSKQVRFRVGSVGISENDIGMGLVDLAGSNVTDRVAGSNDGPKLNKNTTRDSISGYRTEAGSIETIDVSSVTKDIYVRVASRYGYNHIHAWDGYSTAYPGVEMSLVEGYYVFKMPDTSSTKLLFNNGSNSKQTADLSISSSGVYEWNGSSLEKMTSGTISYQPLASSMLSYDGYKYCHVVAASGVSGGTAEYASATSKRAGQYVAVGSLSDGTAVMAWYDSGSGRLALSYNESPRTAQTTLAGGTATWQNNSYYVSDSDIRAGTHVSMAIDKADGVHLAYYSASGGDLYYSYIANPKQKTVTRSVMVDSYGSVGTYPMIDVAKDSKDGNFIPYISFRCESNSDTTASVKIAYPVNWDEDGKVLNGVDSYDRYTGNWEVSVVPTDNTPLTDYTNIGMNKDSFGVKKVFATGTDISKAWSATFAVSDSTTVYGNGTSNPVVSYAVSENGAIEMAQKK